MKIFGKEKSPVVNYIFFLFDIAVLVVTKLSLSIIGDNTFLHHFCYGTGRMGCNEANWASAQLLFEEYLLWNLGLLIFYFIVASFFIKRAPSMLLVVVLQILSFPVYVIFAPEKHEFLGSPLNILHIAFIALFIVLIIVELSLGMYRRSRR
jgi:hypothetical protein